MDEKERDDVSIWCYDGACVQCTDDAGCEHHCHDVDDVVRSRGHFIARFIAVQALGVWTAAALWAEIPADWPQLTRFGVKVFVVMAVYAVTTYVCKGLEKPE
jgi:hypothetical protein